MTGAERVVLVSVGTSEHSFDRLICAVAQWTAQHPELRLVLQHGYSPAVPGAENHRFLPRADLIRVMELAAIVVTQVGPGTVFDANGMGRVPIAMPRDPARHEHVDGHQQAFASVLAARGAATVVHEVTDLVAALDTARQDPDSTRMPARVSPAPQTAARLGARLEQLRAERYVPFRFRRILASVTKTEPGKVRGGRGRELG